MYPSDATVSRVSRELTKRMLCVTSVWKVKTLQWQLLTTNKKRKLGDGLFTEEPDSEEPCAHTAEGYLDRLLTLMLAYALVGTSSALNAPAKGEEDQLGTDSTCFVEVPLDILFCYHSRAKRVAAALPASKRLSWLQARDQEERAGWVGHHREGDPRGQGCPLGLPDWCRGAGAGSVSCCGKSKGGGTAGPSFSWWPRWPEAGRVQGQGVLPTRCT